MSKRRKRVKRIILGIAIILLISSIISCRKKIEISSPEKVATGTPISSPTNTLTGILTNTATNTSTQTPTNTPTNTATGILTNTQIPNTKYPILNIQYSI